VFASTGGVPDPANPAYQGCCINQPDLDMADTTINTSGVPRQRCITAATTPGCRPSRPSGTLKCLPAPDVNHGIVTGDIQRNISSRRPGKIDRRQ
jgi:hypothetical protein